MDSETQALRRLVRLQEDSLKALQRKSLEALERTAPLDDELAAALRGFTAQDAGGEGGEQQPKSEEGKDDSAAASSSAPPEPTAAACGQRQPLSQQQQIWRLRSRAAYLDGLLHVGAEWYIYCRNKVGLDTRDYHQQMLALAMGCAGGWDGGEEEEEHGEGEEGEEEEEGDAAAAGWLAAVEVASVESTQPTACAEAPADLSPEAPAKRRKTEAEGKEGGGGAGGGGGDDDDDEEKEFEEGLPTGGLPFFRPAVAIPKRPRVVMPPRVVVPPRWLGPGPLLLVDAAVEAGRRLKITDMHSWGPSAQSSGAASAASAGATAEGEQQMTTTERAMAWSAASFDPCATECMQQQQGRAGDPFPASSPGSKRLTWPTRRGRRVRRTPAPSSPIPCPKPAPRRAGQPALTLKTIRSHPNLSHTNTTAAAATAGARQAPAWAPPAAPAAAPRSPSRQCCVLGSGCAAVARTATRT